MNVNNVYYFSFEEGTVPNYKQVPLAKDMNKNAVKILENSAKKTVEKYIPECNREKHSVILISWISKSPVTYG